MNEYIYYFTATAIVRIRLEERFDKDPISSTERFFCAEYAMNEYKMLPITKQTDI